jgi:hypothetical protein
MTRWFDLLLPEDGDWVMYAVCCEPWPYVYAFEDRNGLYPPHKLGDDGFMVPVTLH